MLKGIIYGLILFTIITPCNEYTKCDRAEYDSDDGCCPVCSPGKTLTCIIWLYLEVQTLLRVLCWFIFVFHLFLFLCIWWFVCLWFCGVHYLCLRVCLFGKGITCGSTAQSIPVRRALLALRPHSLLRPVVSPAVCPAQSVTWVRILSNREFSIIFQWPRLQRCICHSSCPSGKIN